MKCKIAIWNKLRDLNKICIYVNDIENFNPDDFIKEVISCLNYWKKLNYFDIEESYNE